MFYGGEVNVPGAPGNLQAGGPSFDIRRGAGALGGRSGEQLRRLYEGGTQQNEKLNEELRQRGIMPGGPQLPLAGIPGSSNLPGAVGNMQGIANATFFGGPQIADAGFPPKAEGVYSYPAGMEGVVNVGYPAGSPKYGQPMPSPKHPGRPMEMNRAEFRGLSQMPTGFQNKTVY